MKAYYCTCLVKTGVQVYMSFTLVISVIVLALVLQEPILSPMVSFFSLAASGEKKLMELDLEAMKRSIIVAICIVVCAVNVVSCLLVLVGVWFSRHGWLIPWLVIGVAEALGLVASGTYHLYLLWATQRNYVYHLDHDNTIPVDLVVALRSSLNFGELVIYTILASGGVLLYLAFFLYAWVMVKVLHDQLREASTETAFVMKIVKHL